MEAGSNEGGHYFWYISASSKRRVMKLYRHFKLNEDTEIAVRTSVGESKKEVVKNSVGQGSFRAALASSLNIGCAVQDTFKWNKSALIGYLGLNFLIMQDDISRLSNSLREAREGCNKIFFLLTMKQLSVNQYQV